MAAWELTGRLPVFHYGDDAMRELAWDFMPDARTFDSDAVDLDLPILIYQGSGDEVVAAGQRQSDGRPRARMSRFEWSTTAISCSDTSRSCGPTS